MVNTYMIFMYLSIFYTYPMYLYMYVHNIFKFSANCMYLEAILQCFCILLA